MEDIELKKAQRREALHRRRSLSGEDREKNSSVIRENILQILKEREHKKVFSYCATPEEADLDDLNRLLEESGVKVFYPVTGESGSMEAVAPEGGRWGEDRFGIRIPLDGTAAEPEEIDVVLIPCVSFDRKKNRMGYGKGYYDRYLQRCPQALKIAAAFSCQQTDALACEETDMPMDIIVTEKEILK